MAATKASDIIRELTELMDKHGDLRVCDEYDKSIGGFEYNTDEGERCFVFDRIDRDEE